MSRDRVTLALGIVMTLGSVLLAASFQFVDDHRWYWNAAPAAVSALGVLLAAYGGFLVARGTGRPPERRPWPIALGAVLGLAWSATGIMAFSLAFVGMNYFSPSDAQMGWDSYHGDYLVGWYHIRFLQFATVAGVLAGLAVGRALGGRAARPQI